MGLDCADDMWAQWHTRDKNFLVTYWELFLKVQVIRLSESEDANSR